MFCILFLLAHLESVYSLIWGSHKIWNRVMESQPIRIQPGNSCGKILPENLVGQEGGEKTNLRKAVIDGNLAFGIG